MPGLTAFITKTRKYTLISLRELTQNDAQLLFEWRNDPFIVNLGSKKKTVMWDEHIQWFNKILTDIDKRAYLLDIDGQPAGHVRFEKNSPATCFISIYLIQKYCGKGYGIELMKLACSRIFQEWINLKEIYAEVLTENHIGQKAFLKSNFVLGETVKDKYTFVLSRAENDSAQ